jgi:phage terminase large subunit-like protein
VKNYAAIAEGYAREVVSGKIDACRFVQLACNRHRKDLARKRFAYLFDYDAAAAACSFIEGLPHTKGKWVKGAELMVLSPWQIFIVASIFGWRHKVTGLRRFREAYIEVPRKNGKSSLVAAIGLYMFVADGEPGAEVYCGATTEAQAWEVFRPAKLMAEKAGGFAEHFGVGIHASNLHVVSTSSRFEPVIGKPGDGASPHCAVVDEYHEHTSPEQYDTWVTGMGAREQPLLLVITTAGTSTASPCYDKRGQVVKMLEGTFKNDDLFGIIYTLDPGDAWEDFKNWQKANPNFGVSVFEDYLKARHLEATQRASRQNIIRCKHLNQWMNAGTAFIDMAAWNRAASTVALEEFAGEPCWIGLDLSSKIDVTAIVAVFERDGIYHIFPRFFLPEEAAAKPDRAHYAGWSKEGWLVLTTGSRIDHDVIEENLRDLARNHDVRAIPFDPWNSAQLTGHMLAEGLPMVEVPQTVSHLSGPMKDVEALLLDGKLKHDGNPMMTWMVSNVVARIDKKDNVFPFKERDENKIDGFVALVMAIGQATKGGDDARSVYEDREVRVL